jgi:hypothetical protein
LKQKTLGGEMAGYELRFSETAKDQYLNIKKAASTGPLYILLDAAKQLRRVRALLGQISDSSAGDRSLVIPIREPHILYRSEETYIFYVRVDTPKPVVVLAALCELNVPQAGHILLDMMLDGQVEVLASLGFHPIPISPSPSQIHLQ